MLIHRHSSKLSIPSRYRTVVLLCTLFTVVNLAWYMAIYGFGATRGFKDILKAASLGEDSRNVNSKLEGMIPGRKGSSFKQNKQKGQQQQLQSLKKGPKSLYQRSVRFTDSRLKRLAEQYDNSQPYFIHPEANRAAFPGPPEGPKMNSVLEMAEAALQPVNLDIRQPCGGDQGQGLRVVVFLFCSVADYSRRQAIRETYGGALKNHSQTEIYFVLGRSENKDDEAALVAESTLFNDILQFAFTDAYHNLTLKSVATLRWAALHCSRAQFAFKLDFDCYIRLRPFLMILDMLPPPPTTENTIFGMPPMNQSVIHEQPSKWFIHPLYFPYETYLFYNGGPYLMPVSKLAALYRAVVAAPNTGKLMSLPSLPFDDAYVTGVLAEKAKVGRSILPGLQMLSAEVKRNRSEMDRVVVAYEELEDSDLRWWWDVYGEN